MDGWWDCKKIDQLVYRILNSKLYEKVNAFTELILVRLFLFALISLSLFHWAHRFRFTLYDGLQVKHLNELIATICYGGAIAGTIFTGVTLFL